MKYSILALALSTSFVFNVNATESVESTNQLAINDGVVIGIMSQAVANTFLGNQYVNSDLIATIGYRFVTENKFIQPYFGKAIYSVMSVEGYDSGADELDATVFGVKLGSSFGSSEKWFWAVDGSYSVRSGSKDGSMYVYPIGNVYGTLDLEASNLNVMFDVSYFFTPSFAMNAGIGFGFAAEATEKFTALNGANAKATIDGDLAGVAQFGLSYTF